MALDKPYVVGIDIGGTNTTFGIVDTRGTILAGGAIKTSKHVEFEEYIGQLYNEITRIVEQENLVGQIAGIGVGAPNANYYTGNIEYAPNLYWMKEGNASKSSRSPKHYAKNSVFPLPSPTMPTPLPLAK